MAEPGEGVQPAMSIVVTTVGRPEPFRQLLGSLQDPTFHAAGELILIDQSADQSCAQVLREEGHTLRWRLGTSGRGVSTGRNAGLRLARGDIVGFPDDNAFFAAGSLERVLSWFAEHPEFSGLSALQVTENGKGSMLRWAKDACDVTRANFMHTTISSGMFFRRSALDLVGEFDEGIGVGSAGWLGAGEDSDLLLRVLAAGGRVRYEPSIHVVSADPRAERDDRYPRKMLLYGAGTGHLWRRHRLSRLRLGYYALRKLVGVLLWTVKGDRWAAAADLAYVRGLAAGWTGRAPRGFESHAPAPS